VYTEDVSTHTTGAHERREEGGDEMAVTTITRACGHEVKAVLSADLQRAATEIAQLVTGDCGACVKARRVETRNILWSEVR
jgi:hypothetical protein